MLGRFVRGSITVWLTSCFTGLDEAFWLCLIDNRLTYLSGQIQTSQIGCHLYCDASAHFILLYIVFCHILFKKFRYVFCSYVLYLSHHTVSYFFLSFSLLFHPLTFLVLSIGVCFHWSFLFIHSVSLTSYLFLFLSFFYSLFFFICLPFLFSLSSICLLRCKIWQRHFWFENLCHQNHVHPFVAINQKLSKPSHSVPCQIFKKILTWWASCSLLSNLSFKC